MARASVSLELAGTVGAALRDAAARLAEAGIDRPQAEARLLLEAATGLARATVIGFPERFLAPAELGAFEQAVARRSRHEPASRILGRREFWSLSFEVTPATLDPRPDSETLVTAVLEEFEDRAADRSLIDLGTGTGCLMLALLSELPKAKGVGVDLSRDAIAVAQRNAEALGLAARAHFVVDDWARTVAERFDVVISNPPYVESAAIAGLATEVAAYDPHAALDGGADGLDAYRALLPHAKRLLAPGGFVALEIGQGQGLAIRDLARAAGLRESRSASDLAGIERCLLFRP
jgi:release factor glutamine methyltransferase